MATDIFQGKMISLFVDMKKAPSVYFDYILVTSSTTFEDYLEILNEILKQLNDSGMKVNATKSKRCTTELEFLGFWLTGMGYHPLRKRIESISAILPPKNVKLARAFVGLINFIQNHIHGHAKTLKPITQLTKKDRPFIWGDEQQKSFQ